LLKRKLTDTENDNLTNTRYAFSPTSVAGCISNVECSVGGNLELRQTIIHIYHVATYGLQKNYRKNVKNERLAYLKEIPES
jgi:hypothetical protein